MHQSLASTTAIFGVCTLLAPTTEGPLLDDWNVERAVLYSPGSITLTYCTLID